MVLIQRPVTVVVTLRPATALIPRKVKDMDKIDRHNTDISRRHRKVTSLTTTAAKWSTRHLPDSSNQQAAHVFKATGESGARAPTALPAGR